MKARPAGAAGAQMPFGENRVPRAFLWFVGTYVIVTGGLAEGVQAGFFGLHGGGEGFFTLAVLLALLTDLARLAPLFVYSRHPLGILHPLIITTVLWPLLVAMPGKIQEFGGLGGLFLGEPVFPAFYSGLGWLPGPEIWQAVAWSNLCQLLALLSIYAGYALAGERPAPITAPEVQGDQSRFDGKRLRTLAIVLITVSVGVLLVLISLRGGLGLHLADMARGRFRSMAGLGPLVVAVDLGVIALVVWAAARPRDVKLPIFLVLLIAVSAAQFISNGARSAAFAVFMIVGLAWALRTRQIPWRLALFMVPLFFMAFGVLNMLRAAGQGGGSASQVFEESSTSDVLTRVQEEIEIRRSLESTVPVIWQGQEMMGGPLLGSTYGAAVFTFVPRWVWEAKPRGPGSLFAQTFLGEVREGMAVPVNPTAEAHWNFGIIGVILVSALYGALICLAHNFYVRWQDNPFVLGGFVLFVTTFHPSTDDLVLFQQQTFLLFAMFLLAVPFAARTRPTPILRNLPPQHVQFSSAGRA